jgi:VWFA-related protein
MRLFLLLAFAVSTCAQGQPDIRVDVPLVSVSCSVTTRDGAPVKSLKREDFQLLDNGKARDVQYFWRENDLPLTIGLIADVSGSQAGCIKRHRETFTRFLEQVLGPKDRAFVLTVGGDVKLVTDLTGSLDDLRSGVDHMEGRQRYGTQLGEPCRGPDSPRRRHRRIIPGCGGTALWNGVYAAAKLKMKQATGRKALIVLTDGMDTGSFHNLSDAIEASQGADTIVYTIRCLSPMVMASPGMLIRAAVSRGLHRLSEETGGRAYPTQQDPSAVFGEIETELRNLYVLGFSPPEDARSGGFRKLQVKMVKPGLIARARKGYSAGSDPGGHPVMEKW